MKFIHKLIAAAILALFVIVAFLVFGAATGNAQTVANLNTTDLSVAGVNTGSGLQNAATSMYFQNDGYTLLAIRGGGSPVTATIVTQATTMSQAGYGTVALANQTVSIPSASLVIVGPFPQGRWNNQFGHVGVSLTAVTGVSATTLRMPQ